MLFGGRINDKYQAERLFDHELSEKEKLRKKKDEEKLIKKIEKLSAEIKEIEEGEIYHNAFEWRFEFPEVLADNGDYIGFDVVIGNPPYIFGGGKDISSSMKMYSKEKFVSGKGKINLFTLFIDQSINILGKMNLGCLIIPNTFLRVTSYHITRKYLIDNYNLIQVVDFGDKVFDDAITTAIVILFSKNIEIPTHKVEVRKNLTDSAFVSISSLVNNNYVISLNKNEKLDLIINKLNNNSINLGAIAKELIFGVVITKNLNDVVSTQSRKDWKPFLEGRDIGRFYIKPIEKYLNYNPDLLHRPRTPEIFEATEKLLIQRITGGSQPLKVAYDDKQFYNKESINNLILKDKCDYNIKYINALLNSKLINWFYAIKFTNLSNLTVNLSKKYLSQIPIKRINTNIQKTFIQLVDTIHTEKANNYKADTNKLESQIDILVYKLYDLTWEEVKVVDPDFALPEIEYNNYKAD